MIFILPLPFGSARPVWSHFWVLFVGLLLVCVLIQLVSRSEKNKVSFTVPQGTIFFWSLFVLYGVAQAFLPLAWVTRMIPEGTLQEHNFLWREGLISIRPYSTVSVMTQFLSHFSLFFLVYIHCVSTRRAIWLIKGTACYICLYAVYAIIIYALGNDTLLWFKKFSYQNALSVTFLNRNNFATYTGIGLLATTAWWLDIVSDRNSQVGGGHAFVAYLVQKPFGIFLIIGQFFLLTTLILSGSRGGLIAAFLGLSILILTWVRMANIRLRQTLPYLLGSCVILLALLAFSGELIFLRFNMVLEDGQRLPLYQMTLDTISKNPIVGFGLGSFEDIFRHFRTVALPTNFVRAHNDYLELMVTAGLVSTGLFLGGLVPIVWAYANPFFRRDVERHMAPYVALSLGICVQVGTHALVDFPLQIPGISYTFAILLAATSAITREHSY